MNLPTWWPEAVGAYVLFACFVAWVMHLPRPIEAPRPKAPAAPPKKAPPLVQTSPRGPLYLNSDFSVCFDVTSTGMRYTHLPSGRFVVLPYDTEEHIVEHWLRELAEGR